ncbi:uncharacterized protein BKA55DRAFT_535344 [Fusarium redolens]|uniref:Uncharacterized protein n=1 Tax=Fusarium redolens TaxID=48865 RepID=A0A9P9HY92_FUSRE|nr:uncharacterized protein BKA55DRAFT_535344 [Fusarium redolens]KAH7265416.1 hypothetical protein BKA55DRAFT_535344 [Fusarium redolens]
MQISQFTNIASFLSLTAATVGLWDYTWEQEISVDDLACWSEDKDNVINFMGWESPKNLPLVIAGYEGVDGPHSPLCYTYWVLEYEGRRQAMLVLDHAFSGFATDYETFVLLTDGKAWRTGKANVTTFHSLVFVTVVLGLSRQSKIARLL